MMTILHVPHLSYRLGDPQWAALLLLLHAIGCGFDYIDDTGVAKRRLLNDARVCSHGEQIVVRVALDLFDPGCVRRSRHVPANVGEIAGVLDDRLYQKVVEALRIARGSREALAAFRAEVVSLSQEQRAAAAVPAGA